MPDTRLLLIVAMLAIFATVAPSRLLGFSSEPRFDLSFAIMALGMVVTIPSNLVTALYRARGLYGRIGGLQALGLAIGQVGQVIGIVTTGSLLVVTVAFVAGQLAIAMFLIAHRRAPAISVSRAFPRRDIPALDTRAICWAPCRSR